MDKQILVQNIKKYCAIRGVKPTIACTESGAGKDIINQLEKRGSIPSVERVQLLAQYLGVTTSELLGEEKKPTPEYGSGQDEEEQEVIRLWSQLTQAQKKLLLAWLQTALGEDA